MLRAYKYRIYPTLEQKELIDKTFGVCRLIYNLSLETRSRAWESARVNLGAYSLELQLPELKEAYPWMKEVSSQAIRAAVQKTDVAFNRFFNGAGYPRLSSKKGKQSFRCRCGARRVDFEKRMLTIPKIKNIPIRISKTFKGQVRTITISRTTTKKYYASILVKRDESQAAKPPIIESGAMGVDVGIKSFVVTSDGREFKPNRHLRDSLKRLQCLQRRASRKKKGSGNRKKAALCVAKLYEKISNQRADYIHKITTGLIRDNQANTFVVEDLNVVGLLKNSKLAQSLYDASFGEFFRQMKYKCDWYSKNLIAIDRFAPSSKRCSECGAIKDNLTLSDREWTCSCGTRHDRDLNAAKNIKFFGLNTPVGSRGEPVESRRIRRAKKQETMPNLKPHSSKKL